ncbi:MAG TPA: cytidine deaminase [Longimicrobium sp.]|nr:cytidine deaminase [Longimicrobium sp.]
MNDNASAALLHPDTARSLLDQAIAARAHAYCPYSRFPVGAALLARDGRVFTGVNVENASYGLSNCAERTAIFKAVSEGVHEFTAIAVVGPQNDVECSPCGACRQVLFEFGPDMVVVLADGEGLKQFTARDLLPGAFEAERLPRHEVPV